MRMSQLVPSKFEGSQPAQTAGSIRPGIRRLTAKGRENPQAVKLFRDGLSAGASFKAIATAIKEATGDTLTTPSNVPYFSVRPGDFVVRELAEKILAEFGEDEVIEGVKVRVVKRLPIHLYGDTVEENLDFGYKCFSSSGLQFWSEEASKDEPAHQVAKGDIVCRQFVAPILQNGKAIRQPGGRVPVTRRKCEPGKCPEFQSKACQLKGKLFFYVPGIEVGAPLVLPISSSTFGSQTETTLDDLRKVTKGNLTRFEQPIFFLAKQLDENFPTVDDAGKPKRVKQWITKLVTMVNMPKLRMQSFEAVQAANTAVLALGGVPVGTPSTSTTEIISDDTSDDDRGAITGVSSEPATLEGSVEAPLNPHAAQQLPQASITERRSADVTPAPSPDGPTPASSLQAQVGTLAKNAGLTELARFKVYGNAQFGSGWAKRIDGCNAAIAVLSAIAEPRTKLIQKLAARNVTLENWIVDDPTPPFWDFTLTGINERLAVLSD